MNHEKRRNEPYPERVSTVRKPVYRESIVPDQRMYQVFWQASRIEVTQLNKGRV